MIRRLAILVLGTGSPAAWAQDEVPTEAPPVEASTPEAPKAPSEEEPIPPASPGEEPRDDLSKYRTPFQVLTNRTIGTASQPVAFNWRRTNLQLAATGSFVFELNTFNTARVGGLVRIPNPRGIFEIGIDYTRVWDSRSSRDLAQTRFRQPGRPTRLEIDATLALPLAEGVVTSMPKWFPSVQLVFNGLVGLRYSIYPAAFRGLRPGEVIGAIVSPGLSTDEIENLEDLRLRAMNVDPTRYTFTAGFTNDLYFERGVFLSPRVIFAVPLLAPAIDSQLPFWLDVSLAFGVAL